jgi:hypothetical protein
MTHGKGHMAWDGKVLLFDFLYKKQKLIIW